MILPRKRYGLVNETGSFLANPAPEASEPAVVEASGDFNKKSYSLVNETGSFLVNPGPEASEPAV